MLPIEKYHWMIDRLSVINVIEKITKIDGQVVIELEADQQILCDYDNSSIQSRYQFIGCCFHTWYYCQL